jgi:hypothetical protein
MKGRRRFRIAVLLFLLAWLAGSVALAQSGNRPSTSPTAGYDLTWYTVDAGGHTLSTGGDYTLGGTVGQPDPGLMSGGTYVLGGGFWGGGAVQVPNCEIYLPLILRNG